MADQIGPVDGEDAVAYRYRQIDDVSVVAHRAVEHLQGVAAQGRQHPQQRQPTGARRKSEGIADRPCSPPPPHQITIAKSLTPATIFYSTLFRHHNHPDPSQGWGYPIASKALSIVQAAAHPAS